MTDVPPDHRRQTAEPRPAAADRIGVALSLVWLVGVGGYLLWGGDGATTLGSGVMTFLAVFLPLALIWGAVTTARTLQALRAETARLHDSVEAIRREALRPAANPPGIDPAVEQKLTEIAAATARQAEATLAVFASRRDLAETLPKPEPTPAPAPKPAVAARARPRPPEDEPALALGAPEDDRPPISIGDFIRAMNFPDSAEDRDGFRALRAALEDRTVTRLVRAAQDVLTLLAQDGIFMDDLRPERARPELWRRFAQGERGRAISGLGGVRDRSSLALTSGRMRSDPVFRDAAHHFLRQFDKTFQDFEKNASDAEVAELAETRTARAFMLFGRVTGIFD